MTTKLEAEAAKTKLKTQFAGNPALNGIGLTWDAQGNWVVVVLVRMGTDIEALGIPKTVNTVPVKVEAVEQAVAF